MSLMPPVMPALSPQERRRFLLATLAKAVGATLVVLVLYYLLPIDSIPDGLLFVALGVADSPGDLAEHARTVGQPHTHDERLHPCDVRRRADCHGVGFMTPV